MGAIPAWQALFVSGVKPAPFWKKGQPPKTFEPLRGFGEARAMLQRLLKVADDILSILQPH